MAFSLYDASIPLMVRMLQNLDAILDKGAAHAAAKGIAPATMIEAKFAPDMFNLARQVQSASDAAKAGAARLANETPPSMADTETTFDELKARIAKTISLIQGFTPEQINSAETRTITVPLRAGPIDFTAGNYLTQFVLPNFFFHVTTAYDLLRHQGVEVGKMDFLGKPPSA